MDTPFRNDVDALKTRLSSLDEELATLRERAREYEAVRERLAQVEREHQDIRREIDARSVRRPAPLLDTLRVASPCHESWDDMIGDGRTRFCGKCQKNVHNLSELTRAEAEAFLESVAGPVCVRMYQRADGTLLTADCPVGVRKKRVKRLFLATIGGGLAAAAGALAVWAFEETMVMGEMPMRTVGQLEAPPLMGTAMPSGLPLPDPSFATPPTTTSLPAGSSPRTFATPPGPSFVPPTAGTPGSRPPSRPHRP